ncbi:DUF6168 family protein [Flavobacteriaceae bacterium F89]|uniref:DUF6168 family protein n=1 Tax=Cerina litoralis TaxID=2874477 RepID=A0AAE3EV97_9FLAO|nr:DUF6168 family protein [Cerina litoralis]MCG2460939.1 DUF6168 family protein [Cerina litoralis]
MIKRSLPLQFVLALSLSLMLALCVHLGVLYAKKLPLFANLLLWSYGLNFLLATAIFPPLYFYRHRLKQQIGFVHLAGSFLKFLVFFIVFYPVYKADGHMDTLEFAAFFVPYTISLVIETVFTTKMLRRLES